MKDFPVLRCFDDDVLRYVRAYEKTYKHLSTLDDGMLPESRTERANFCRAVTTSLLIEFGKKEKDCHVVFEKPKPKRVVKEEVVESIEASDSTVKPSVEPSVVNSHEKAGLCSYWGRKLIEDEQIDPKRVIARKLNTHSLPKGVYAHLMSLREDYKVERWQDIDIETLACFVYAEELMHLPSDKIPEGDE